MTNINLKKELGFAFLLGITAFFVALSSCFLVEWLISSHKTNSAQTDLIDDTPISIATDENTANINPPADSANAYWDFIKLPLISVSFTDLLRQNSDTVAWVQIKNTNINYPVTQTNNNNYYLTHAFDKSTNSAGWIFADYRNNMQDFDQNTIIYGHSRYDTTMFGTLKNAITTTWFNNPENHVIYLSTPSANTSWQVFSIYQIEPESYYLTTTFSSDQSFQSFINTLVNRSTHNFNTTVSTQDKILTLSTCANNATNDRIVLHARLIKSQTR